IPSWTRKKPSAVRSPVRNSASYGSTSLVTSVALSASVRATRIVGTPATSAASRAAFSVRTKWLVGTSTLPPRWPHFFSEESWSSKWTPAAPASISAPISSYAFSGPPKPGAAERVVQPLDERRHAVGRIEALVGVRRAREVRVGRDLPAGEVERLQPGL